MQKNPFEHLTLTPANHFRLYFYAAVSLLIDQLARDFGGHSAALELFPFLTGYCKELTNYGFKPGPLGDGGAKWAEVLADWEAKARYHLPLRALASAAHLDFRSLRMLLTIGLVEEDNRFGFVFEHAQGTASQPRPTIGLLQAGLGDHSFGADPGPFPIGKLLDLALVRVANPEAPRSSQALQIPAILWDAIRGEIPGRASRWMRYRKRSELADLPELNLPRETGIRIQALPAFFASGEVRSLIVRGPEHSGRRTLVGSVAKSMDRDLLEIAGVAKGEDDRYRLIGPLATLLHAMPLIVLDLGPGETADLPCLESYDGPTAILLSKQGGVSGPIVERSLSFSMGILGIEARRRHWTAALGQNHKDDHADQDDRVGSDPFRGAELDIISERFRMVSGNIHRAAHLAKAYAALEQRDSVTANDVLQASRALNQQTLDALAKRVLTFGSWERLAVAGPTIEELRNLESRCRHRERLQAITGATIGADLNAGVRVLFHGPSGTGKTLAAQVLAAQLQMDLYRIDLSTVVNKYIGESEKNLDRVLSRAEELDVILLLDEGDALLTQRTSIHTANDRYANLETNFLLQRLESFEGILIITTNAVERIDSAFQRRMDVVVDFRPPDAAERWNIWQMHLPSAHEVDLSSLAELATRCVMTGGQIRNAALHASVLALDRGEAINFSHIEPAVQREYRKTGGVCPLRTRAASFAAASSAVWQ